MVVLALLAALAAQAPASDTSSLDGIWRSPGGNSIMKIAACGDAPCGTVAWASDKAKKDSAKTTPDLVGTQLLTDLKQEKNGSWTGKLFIPDRNMRVTAKIQRLSPDQLKVSGCAMGKAMCKAQTWTSWTGDLPADTSKPAPK